MAGAALKPRMTLDEFLAWDAKQPEKWEFYGGRPWLKDRDPATGMAGGTISHAVLASNLQRTLGNRLANAPCRPLADNMRVIAAGHAYIPDAIVLCRPPRLGELELADPTAIIEILSPTTEAFDRGAKWQDYQQIPTLETYALVSQDQPLVEIFTRNPDGGWLYERFAGPDAVATIPPLSLALPLTELYQDVPFEASEVVAEAHAPAR